MKNLIRIRNLIIFVLVSFTVLSHSKVITFKAANLKDSDLSLLGQIKATVNAGNTIKGQTDDITCELVNKVGKVWWHPTKKLEDVIEKPLPKECIGKLPKLHETEPPVAGLKRVNMTVDEFNAFEEKATKARDLLEKEKRAARGEASISLEEKRQLENERGKLEQLKQQLEDLKKKGVGTGGGTPQEVTKKNEQEKEKEAFDPVAYLNEELARVTSINDIKKVVHGLQGKVAPVDQLGAVEKELDAKLPRSKVVIDGLNALIQPATLNKQAQDKIKKFVQGISDLIAQELVKATDAKGIVKFVETYLIPVFGKDTPRITTLLGALDATLLIYNIPLIIKLLAEFNDGDLDQKLAGQLIKILTVVAPPLSAQPSLAEQKVSDQLVIATLADIAKVTYTQSGKDFSIGSKKFKAAQAFDAYLYFIGYTCKKALGNSDVFKKRTVYKVDQYEYPHQEIEIVFLGVEGDVSQVETYAKSQLKASNPKELENIYKKFSAPNSLLVKTLKENIFADCIFDAKTFNADPYVNALIEAIVANVIVAQRPAEQKNISDIDKKISDNQVIEALKAFIELKDIQKIMSQKADVEKAKAKVTAELKELTGKISEFDRVIASSTNTLNTAIGEKKRLEANLQKKENEKKQSGLTKLQLQALEQQILSIKKSIEGENTVRLSTTQKIETAAQERKKLEDQRTTLRTQDAFLDKQELGTTLNHDYLFDLFYLLMALRINPSFIKLEIVQQKGGAELIFEQLFNLINPAITATGMRPTSIATSLSTAIRQQLLFDLESLREIKQNFEIGLSIAISSNLAYKRPLFLKAEKEKAQAQVKLAQNSPADFVNSVLPSAQKVDDIKNMLLKLKQENKGIADSVVRLEEELNELSPDAKKVIDQLNSITGGKLSPGGKLKIQQLMQHVVKQGKVKALIDALKEVYEVYAVEPGMPVGKKMYDALKSILPQSEHTKLLKTFIDIKRSPNSVWRYLVGVVGSGNVNALKKSVSSTFETDLNGMLEPYADLLQLILVLQQEKDVVVRFEKLKLILSAINTMIVNEGVKDIIAPFTSVFITPTFKGKLLKRAPYTGAMGGIIKAYDSYRFDEAIQSLNDLISKANVDDTLKIENDQHYNKILQEIGRMMVETAWQGMFAQLNALEGNGGTFIISGLPIDKGANAARNLGVYVALRDGLFAELQKIVATKGNFDVNAVDKACQAIIDQLDKQLNDSNIKYTDKSKELEEVKHIITNFVNDFGTHLKSLHTATQALNQATKKEEIAAEPAAGGEAGGHAPEAPDAPPVDGEAPEAPDAPPAPDVPEAPEAPEAPPAD